MHMYCIYKIHFCKGGTEVNFSSPGGPCPPGQSLATGLTEINKGLSSEMGWSFTSVRWAEIQPRG